MVVKVYISGISGNKEVKKRQQRVLMILDSKNIKYEIIDITEPGRESDKDFMQNNSKSNGATVSDPNPRSPLPPQIFNNDEYCGDYDQFDLANELDTLEQFLKVELPPDNPVAEEKPVNGDVKLNENGSKENSIGRDSTEGNDKENKSLDDPTNVDQQIQGSENSENIQILEKEEVEDIKTEEVEDIKTGEVEDIKTEETNNSSNEVASNILKEETTVSNSEITNKNGSASSREVSVEKEVEVTDKKDNPSEALIQSEQAAASE